MKIETVRTGTAARLVRMLALTAVLISTVSTLPAQETVEARLAALEARIQQLETELASAKLAIARSNVIGVSGAGSSAGTSLVGAAIRPAVYTTTESVETLESAVAAPAAAAPPQQADFTDDFEGLNFFKGVTVGGFLDAYYNWNTNEPPDMITTIGTGLKRNFDFNHNSLTLNQFDLEIIKATSDTSPLGYALQLAAGPTADLVNSNDFTPETGNSTAAHFMQYYLSGRVGLATVDFGKFVTPHGAEVIDNRANMNYSRGLLFALAIPYYHFGLRASIPVNDMFSVSGYLVNGWNNVVDNNKGKTVGVGVAINPAGPISFVQNYMVGPEQAGNSDDFRHLFDSVLTIKAGENITFVANYDYGMDTSGGDHVHWQGIATYLKLQAGAFAVTPRFEYYSDPMGFTTGANQRIREFTLTPEFIIKENLITRFEYRHDWSTQGVFTVDEPDDDPTKQHTLGVGMILKF